MGSAKDADSGHMTDWVVSASVVGVRTTHPRKEPCRGTNEGLDVCGGGMK